MATAPLPTHAPRRFRASSADLSSVPPKALKGPTAVPRLTDRAVWTGLSRALRPVPAGLRLLCRRAAPRAGRAVLSFSRAHKPPLNSLPLLCLGVHQLSREDSSGLAKRRQKPLVGAASASVAQHEPH